MVEGSFNQCGFYSFSFLKKQSDSEFWETEGHDSESDLHVDPNFPRVLWPLPSSDEVKKQVDFKIFDSVEIMSNQI